MSPAGVAFRRARRYAGILGAYKRMTEFKPTARVKLTGLVARPELNGSNAVVLFQIKDRYAISLCAGREEIRVKPANLIMTPSLNAVLDNDLRCACLAHIPARDIPGTRSVCTQWREGQSTTGRWRRSWGA